jgi:hypothetical protein
VTRSGGTSFLCDPDYTSFSEASRLLGEALAQSSSERQLIPSEAHTPPERQPRLRALQYVHGSIRIRMEQSKWFGDQVVRLRATRSGAGEERRRCFEAFLFFARGVLDCEAFYAHRLCELDMKDSRVYITSIGSAVSTNGRPWPELARVLDAYLGSSSQQTWFHHFNHLRTLATHRSIVPTGGFIGNSPDLVGLADILFVPENLDNPHGTWAPRPELGLGEIVEKSHKGVCSLVSEVETVLLDYIRQRRVTL